MCCSDIHWIYVGNISDTHIVHTLVIMYLDICMCALKLSMNGSKSLQSLSCKALSSLGAPLDVPNTVYCSLFLDGAATEQYFNQYKKKKSQSYISTDGVAPKMVMPVSQSICSHVQYFIHNKFNKGLLCCLCFWSCASVGKLIWFVAAFQNDYESHKHIHIGVFWLDDYGFVCLGLGTCIYWLWVKECFHQIKPHFRYW